MIKQIMEKYNNEKRLEEMIKLEHYEGQYYNKDKALATMKFEFFDGVLARGFMIDSADLKLYPDRALLMTELNEILDGQLSTWEEVANLVDEMKCLEDFNADDMALYFAKSEKHYFLIRLVPLGTNKIHAFEK